MINEVGKETGHGLQHASLGIMHIWGKTNWLEIQQELAHNLLRRPTVNPNKYK